MTVTCSITAWIQVLQPNHFTHHLPVLVQGTTANVKQGVLGLFVAPEGAAQMPYFHCMVQLSSSRLAFDTRYFSQFRFPLQIMPTQCRRDF